jgi:hypothetical protein
MNKYRTPLGLATLALATLVLTIRVREINEPRAIDLAPRTLHLLYLDSLRQELLTFAEQYGRPVFQYDTTSPVTGHGRIQLARLRHALFDPRIEYVFGDEGFALEWRSDPKPRPRFTGFVSFGQPSQFHSTAPVAGAWPQSAVEYARIRRLVITPQWPDRPAFRANRRRRSPVPPHGDGSASLLTPATGH